MAAPDIAPSRGGRGGGGAPSRRILEVTIVAMLLARPVFGSMRLWAIKTMAATTPGSIPHTAAEVVAILT